MDEGHGVVRLPADITDDVVDTVASQWRDLARAPSMPRLTLDARDTKDLSARGLGLLVAMTRLARSRGARVVIIDVDESLHTLFAAARLDYVPRLSSVHGEQPRNTA